MFLVWFWSAYFKRQALHIAQFQKSGNVTQVIHANNVVAIPNIWSWVNSISMEALDAQCIHIKPLTNSEPYTRNRLEWEEK